MHMLTRFYYQKAAEIFLLARDFLLKNCVECIASLEPAITSFSERLTKEEYFDMFPSLDTVESFICISKRQSFHQRPPFADIYATKNLPYGFDKEITEFRM